MFDLQVICAAAPRNIPLKNPLTYLDTIRCLFTQVKKMSEAYAALFLGACNIQEKGVGLITTKNAAP